MPKLTLAGTIVAMLVVGGGVSNAATIVPCEDLLKQLRDAEKSASLTPSDRGKVTELENKGVERCNADDDKRADGFFDEALKIIAKH